MSRKEHKAKIIIMVKGIHSYSPLKKEEVRVIENTYKLFTH